MAASHMADITGLTCCRLRLVYIKTNILQINKTRYSAERQVFV